MLAAVGVVVLVVAVIALHDPKNPSAKQAGPSQTVTTTRSASPGPSSTSTSSSSSPDSGSPSTPSSATPGLTTAQLKSAVPLVVLNNTTTTGLAAEAAQRFEQGGWTVTSTGNLVNDIISTCAYYDPSVAHAEDAAKALQQQYPTIQRVEPRFDGLVAGPVVVVLTPGYSNG